MPSNRFRRQIWRYRNSQSATKNNAAHWIYVALAGSLVFCQFFQTPATAQTQQLQQAEASAVDRAKLKMRFFHEGQPVKASVIIANETSRLEFNDVLKLETAAPRRATYTITADTQGAGKITFKDVIPVYEIAASSADLEVHFPTVDDTSGYEPLLLIKEAGGRLNVKSNTTARPAKGGSFELSTVVSGKSGQRFILDTLLSTGAAENNHSCQAPCLHTFPPQAQIDCSVHCYTCSSTATLQGNVWKENFNMCESLTTPTGGGGGVSDDEDGVFEITSSFQALPEGEGGVALAVALRNDAALFPSQTKLRAVAGGRNLVLAAPFKERAYPDFIAPAGNYIYSVLIPDTNAPGGAATYSLPVQIPDQRIVTLQLNLPTLENLNVGTAHILGDTRLGLALTQARLSKSSSRRYRLTTNLDDVRDDIGWVAVALPKGIEKVRIRQTGGARRGLLTEGRDYVLTKTKDASLVTLATGTGVSRYIFTIS